MDRHLVVVSRQWHEPFIRVSVTDLDIKVVMGLEDFAQAVSQELGRDVAAAVQRVIDGMKRETSRAL